MGLPRGSISRTVVESGDCGAWNQLERGELTLSEFAEKFTKEVTQKVKQIYSVLSVTQRVKQIYSVLSVTQKVKQIYSVL